MIYTEAKASSNKRGVFGNEVFRPFSNLSLRQRTDRAADASIN